MSEQKLPNSESIGVIKAAIAWEIVRNTTTNEQRDTHENARIRITNAYIETFLAIYNNESIKQDK